MTNNLTFKIHRIERRKVRVFDGHLRRMPTKAILDFIGHVPGDSLLGIWFNKFYSQRNYLFLE